VTVTHTLPQQHRPLGPLEDSNDISHLGTFAAAQVPANGGEVVNMLVHAMVQLVRNAVVIYAIDEFPSALL
jgi:hypothetical protein